MERRIIVPAALAHGQTHSLELAFAALLLRIGHDFGIELAALGAIANAGTFTFGATAIPSGLLTDRFGPRVVIAGCVGGAAVCALGVAAAPNVAVLAVALALLGAAIGFYHPAGTAMVSTVMRRRGLAFAAHGVAGNLGVALIPALAVGTAILVHWRAAYILLAVSAAVVALIAWRMAPSRAEWHLNARRASAQVADVNGGGRPRSVPPAARRWLSRPLLLIYTLSIGMGLIYRGALTFLAVHLEERLDVAIFGWSPEAVAGAMTSLVLLTAVLGQVVGGTLSDRMTIERANLPVVIATGPLLLLVSFSTGVPLLLFTAGFVIANFAQQPIVNGLIADYAPPGTAGRAFGISFFLVFGIGSVSASASGFFADRAGTDATFLMLAAIGGCLAAISVAVAVGAERRRGTRAAGETLAVPGG